MKRERDKPGVRDRRDSEFEDPKTSDVRPSHPRRSSRESHISRAAILRKSQQFPNVQSVQIPPRYVMRQSRRFPYPIHTLVETHFGTDLEIFQAVMKVVLCEGM